MTLTTPSTSRIAVLVLGTVHVPDLEPTALLHGPYAPPALRKGDRTVCLFRDAQVVITSWSNARIPWPRCRALHQRGGSGLLVDEELARAVRTESAAAAVRYCWGVGEKAIWHWRAALGVNRLSNPTTHRLIQAAAARGAATQDRRWTRRELALLGTQPDAEVAAKIGRGIKAVGAKRRSRGIAPLTPTASSR
jgi:hypothetical protein